MVLKKEKELLRKRVLEIRNNLSSTAKKSYDSWICQSLEEKIIQEGHKKIHSYLPIKSEIDIRSLLQSLLHVGVSVYVSKTLTNRRLEHFLFDSFDSLEQGVYGTWHPINAERYEGDFDLIIVPGAVFDKDRYRIGYGAGYYDTFLSNHHDSYKIGVAYPFQIVDKVPRGPHDIPMDEVLIRPEE